MSSDGWSQERVRIRGLSFHYWRTGGSGPPLILAHGLTDSGACWRRVARALQDEFDIIMPDARGHGASDKPSDGYDYPTLAADLTALIEALGLERPLIVGHSMGAGTAATAAAGRGGRGAQGGGGLTSPAGSTRADHGSSLFGALVLEDPPFGARKDWSRARCARYAQLQCGELASRKELSLEALVERARAELHPGWHDEELVPWARAKHDASAEAFALFRAPAPDPRKLLPRIESPVLLLAGEPRLGSAMQEQTIEACRDLIRRGRAVRFPDAGHNIRRDAFEPFMSQVLAFLREQA